VKVYVFPADEAGCGHYRLIWPAEQLQRMGHSIEIVATRERNRALQAKMSGDRMVSVNVPRDADVIVFQRVTHKYLVQAFALLRQNGIAVVVDMDDDLTCIHPANPAFHMLHPSSPYADHSWQNTLLACETATLVTVSTPALLQRYAKHGRGRVLYNAVPKMMLDVPHIDSNVVGWAGSVHSHPTDLQVMGPTPAQLLQLGAKFKIVGPLDGIHKAFGVPLSVEIEFTGPVDIEAWPLAVNSLGIGVAPLADSKFNAAKSWLKLLEYGALGIPAIASPRAEYSRLHKLGVGWLASKPSEWKTKLRTLIDSEQARLELGAKSREAVSKQTIEENAWRWWESWADALAIQRSSPLGRRSQA